MKIASLISSRPIPLVVGALIALAADSLADANGKVGDASHRIVHALVVGNAAYDPPLRAPLREADAVSQALKKSGITTVAVMKDATRSGLRDRLEALEKKGADGGVALFYFTGSAVRWEGRDWLIPIGFGDTKPDDWMAAALPLDEVRTRLGAAGFAHVVAIMDACRNVSPAAKSGAGNGVAVRPPEPAIPKAAFTALYAASAGEFAVEQAHGLSPFCEAFLRAVSRGSRPFPEIALEVMSTVASQMKGSGIDQRPAFESNASMPLQLGYEPEQPAPSVAPVSDAAEATKTGTPAETKP